MTTQTINLEMIPKGIPPIIHVSQYDKGQTWNFNLLLNGQAFPVPAGSNVTIQGTKPDQTGFQYACTFSGSVVTAEEEEQMTVLPGDTKAEIVIGNSGDIIASINIIIRVEPTALSDDTQISETDLPLIQEAAQAAEVVPGLVEDAEAWAKGTRDGQAVPSTDPTYENNSKFYAEQAATATAHAPYIGLNGNWYVWDTATSQYIDTGEPSQGSTGATGPEGPEGPAGPTGNGLVSIQNRNLRTGRHLHHFIYKWQYNDIYSHQRPGRNRIRRHVKVGL